MRRSRGKAARMAAVCVGSFLFLVYFLYDGLNPVSDQLTMPETWTGRARTALGHQPSTIDKQARSDAQQLHQRRRALLDMACATHQRRSRKRRLLTAGDLRHLIVDDQHGLLYCYVPKVACTNWKRVMMVLTGAGRYTDPLAIPAHEAHVAANLRTLDTFSPAEINRRLRHYLKFLFVREPFERLVSAYRNKFTRAYNTAFHRRYGTTIVRRHRRRPSTEALQRGADVSFQEFVWYLVDPKTRRDGPFNEHWETVYSLCHPCLIRYDVLGRYETLASDARYLLALARLEPLISFPASAGGPQAGRTTAAMAAGFFRNVSPFYQRKLFQLYQLDFALFNYSVPSYLHLV